MSCTGGCLRGEEILFEEVLANKFFQIPLEALAVNGLVSFTVVIITVLFYSGEGSYWIGLGCLTHDRSLMALKTSMMESLSGVRWSVLKFWDGFGERTGNVSFVGWLPPILLTSMGWSFMSQLRLLSIATAFERLVDKVLHCFFQLDVRLGSGHDITHPSDVLLQ